MCTVQDQMFDMVKSLVKKDEEFTKYKFFEDSKQLKKSKIMLRKSKETNYDLLERKDNIFHDISEDSDDNPDIPQE